MIDLRFEVQDLGSPPRRRNTSSPAKSEIAVVANPALDDEIRIYAYEIYQHRGGNGDHAVEDWLAAEAYLAARKNRANKVRG